jgi:hypothetical protein
MTAWPFRLKRVPGDLGSARGWRAAWLWAVAAVLWLRLGVGLVMGAAWLVVKPSLPADQVADAAVYGGLPVYTTFPANAILGVWQRWDAVHHLNLARLGYSGVSEGDSVFYPLYAGLTRMVTRVLGCSYLVGGLVVSTVAATAAFACLYRLVDQQRGLTPARWTVVTLAVYPAALFLVAPYTESLFLALTLGAFLAAYERHWWLAGVLGALASLTRGPGLLTSAALGWIAWRQWRGKATSSPVRWAIQVAVGLALPVLAGLAFGLWRERAGFAPIGEVVRDYSGLEMTNPINGLTSALVQLTTTADLPVLLDLASALLFLGLTAAMAVNRRWRRGDWLIYMVVNQAVFLSKHSLVASSLQSLARYVLVLFPGFIVIGDWLSRRGSRLRFVHVVISGTLLFVLSALYALWWFIG